MIKPKDMYCFKQVAAVIGEERAEIELQKVLDNTSQIELTTEYGFTENSLKECELLNCFDFDGSPQGWDFWCDINTGLISYKDSKIILPEQKDNPLPQTLKFLYRNWKGNYSEREVIPIEMKYMKSIYHQELGENWFLVAKDKEKGEERAFAVVDIIKWL